MKKSDVFIIISIIVLIVTYIFIKIFTYKSENILMNYARRNSTNIVTKIINNSTYEVLYNKTYGSLISIDKNNQNDITSLNFDNAKINNILYSFTSSLLSNIKTLESNSNFIYTLPIGVIYSLPILVNIGPNIPFKIDILGDADSSSSLNVREYGINSVVVEVVLNVELTVQIILPFVSQTHVVNKQIILDSKIIQGNIPDYYGNFSPITEKFNMNSN